MAFNPIIFDIISDLHSVSTHLNMHNCTYEYREFLSIFLLIGAGNFETALCKLYTLNNKLTLPAHHMIWHCGAVEKLRDIVEK